MHKKILCISIILSINSNNFINAMENDQKQEPKEKQEGPVLKRVIKISSVNRTLVDPHSLRESLKKTELQEKDVSSNKIDTKIESNKF
jgi:hypothetical protein